MTDKTEFGLALEGLQKRMHKLKKADMEREGFLHSGELAVIKFVARHHHRLGKAPTLVDISNVLGVSQATVTVSVDRLIKKELLTKQPSPTDKRAKVLFVTEKGMTYLQSTHGRQLAMLQSISEVLGPEDTAHLVRIVEKINGYLDSQKDGAS